MQRRDQSAHFLWLDADRCGDFLDRLFFGRQELVQGRIEQPNRHWQPLHGGEDADEVLTLVRQEFLERLLAILPLRRENHPSHVGDAIRVEEHVLGPRQSDAFGAEAASTLRIRRRIGIGPHTHASLCVGPLHERVEVVGHLRSRSHDRPAHHFAGRAVQRQYVARPPCLLANPNLSALLVDLQLMRTSDAALAPATRHNGRMRGHATGTGQNANRVVHALDVFGRGLAADQQHVFAILRAASRFFGAEGKAAAGGAGRGGQAAGNDVGPFLVLGGVTRQQQVYEILGLHSHQGLVTGDEPRLDHFDRYPNGRGRGALARSRLKHPQMSTLDRELHVLHIPVVPLKFGANLHELLEDRLVPLPHFSNRRRGSNARDDILTLRVDEKLAVELVLPSRGVAGKGHACSGVVAHIPEDHRLHIDGGAVETGDLVDLPVGDGLARRPRSEDRFDRMLQLLIGVLREADLGKPAKDLLVSLAQIFKTTDRHIRIVLHAELLFDGIEFGLEVVMVDLKDDASEHVDEATVGVKGKPPIVGQFGEPFDRAVVETKVEHGFHHARHRHCSAAADADKKRIARGTKSLARLLL